MIIVDWSTGQNKSYITYAMCRAFIFTCVMTIASNLSIIFIFSKLFFINVTRCCIMMWFYFFVNSNIFLIPKWITFAACSLRQLKNFFMHYFLKYKVCLFSILVNTYIGDIEYPQERCLSIFLVEYFCGLFVHTFIFPIK